MEKMEEHFMSNFNSKYDIKKQPPRERCDCVTVNFVGKKKNSRVASFKARVVMLSFPGTFSIQWSN